MDAMAVHIARAISDIDEIRSLWLSMLLNISAKNTLCFYESNNFRSKWKIMNCARRMCVTVSTENQLENGIVRILTNQSARSHANWLWTSGEKMCKKTNKNFHAHHTNDFHLFNAQNLHRRWVVHIICAYYDICSFDWMRNIEFVSNDFHLPLWFIQKLSEKNFQRKSRLIELKFNGNSIEILKIENESTKMSNAERTGDFDEKFTLYFFLYSILPLVFSCRNSNCCNQEISSRVTSFSCTRIETLGIYAIQWQFAVAYRFTCFYFVCFMWVCHLKCAHLSRHATNSQRIFFSASISLHLMLDLSRCTMLSNQRLKVKVVKMIAMFCSATTLKRSFSLSRFMQDEEERKRFLLLCFYIFFNDWLSSWEFSWHFFFILLWFCFYALSHTYPKRV